MTEAENMNPEEMSTEESEPRTPFEEFLYHQRRALEETGKALEALLPEGFRTHGNNASKEFSKGFKVLVDAAMDEFRKGDAGSEDQSASNDDDSPSTTGKTKVKVQVD